MVEVNNSLTSTFRPPAFTGRSFIIKFQEDKKYEEEKES